MERHLLSSRPVSESLFKAANAIVSAGDRTRAAGAVRDAALALEYHLDTLARELSSRDEGIDPGFRSRAEAVEADLRDVLRACWDYQRVPSYDGDGAARRAALARDLRNVASQEIDLVFDQLNAPPALD